MIARFLFPGALDHLGASLKTNFYSTILRAITSFGYNEYKKYTKVKYLMSDWLFIFTLIQSKC